MITSAVMKLATRRFKSMLLAFKKIVFFRTKQQR